MASTSDNDYRKGSGKLVEHFKDIKKKQGLSKKRLALKEQIGGTLLNHEISFRVISTGAYNTCKSVMLQTEFLSYLFNCGDGVLRQCMDNGGKWTKLEHIFVTHKSYRNLAGTLELSAGIAALGAVVDKLSIHGHGSLDCLVHASARTFAQGALKPLIKQPTDIVFEDHTLTAESVRLSDQTDPTSDEAAASAFKLTFKAPKRKVDAKNLVKFCVKPGPWIRQLIDNNEPVEVGGKLITPEMILEDAKPSKCTLVIDCPTMHHLASLTELKDKLCKREDNNFVDLVIHMTPDNIVQQPLYQQFISLFPSTTTQIMLPETEDITLRYPWEQQVHLNLIDKDIFPFLHPKPVEESKTDALDTQTEIEDTENVIKAKPGLIYDLVHRKVRSSRTDDSTVESAFKYFSDEGQRERVLAKVKERVSRTDHSVTRQYPIVVMLGTGGSRSTNTRNTAGILVETSKDNFILLDCGYGILGQFSVLYGPERTEHILRNLKMIFVSHGHADHHGGLLSLFPARKAAFGGSTPSLLHLLTPRKLCSWFDHLDCQFDRCLENVRFIHCESTTSSTNDTSAAMEIAAVVSNTRLKSITTVNVTHAYSKSCYGISLQHQNWKLVYSGDTMPCDSLIQAAMGADLLIHEATFGDTYFKDAKIKTHCTTSQALDVARRSKAKFTLLTHFSNRHSRMPDYSHELFNATNVGIAYDNMVLRPKDLPNTVMSSLYDVLVAMYPKHVSSNTEHSRLIVNRKVEGMSPAEIVASMNARKEEQLKDSKRKLSDGDDVDNAKVSKLDEDNSSADVPTSCSSNS